MVSDPKFYHIIMHVDIFAVDLISCVHAPTVRLKTVKISSTHLHLTNHRRPAVAIHVEASNNAYVLP